MSRTGHGKTMPLVDECVNWNALGHLHLFLDTPGRRALPHLPRVPSGDLVFCHSHLHLLAFIYHT